MGLHSQSLGQEMCGVSLGQDMRSSSDPSKGAGVNPGFLEHGKELQATSGIALHPLRVSGRAVPINGKLQRSQERPTWVALTMGQAQQAQSHKLPEGVLYLLASPLPTFCPPPPRLGLKEPPVNGEVVSPSQLHLYWESQL